MNKWLLCLGLATRLAAAPSAARDPTLVLATELSAENRHAAAAVEYRRLALTTGDATDQAAFYWMAAYHYGQLGNPEITETMLTRAESADWRQEPAIALLRAETAFRRDRRSEARFFFNTLPADDTADTAGRHAYATRRLAVLDLRDGSPSAALSRLNDAGVAAATSAVGREALERFQAGRDKRPRLGGWLGLVPGLGYAYSGEYANAVRSLLLNSLFIYGMLDSAERQNWGPFSAITFFELTWYTGSIYGGVDAAHRYNRRRLEDTEQAILGQSRFEPRLPRLPLLHFRFDF